MTIFHIYEPELNYEKMIFIKLLMKIVKPALHVFETRRITERGPHFTLWNNK